MTPSFRVLALGLLCALSLTACDSGTDNPDDGDDVAASGTLENSFDRPVDGATMTFASTAGRGTEAMPSYTATTGANGSFNLQIPPGTYTLTITHPNYGTTTTTVVVSASGQVTISSPVAGPGLLETLVVNALNGTGIPNSSVRCSYQRANGSYPDPATSWDFEATTDANGAVNVAGIPFGPMQCVAVTPFGNQSFNVTIASTGTTSAPPVTSVPLPNAGEYRVVLTWGTSPTDLDSHVTGPDGSGGRFHVYYGNRTFGNTTLDLDDTSGEGPETITVNASSAATGEYLYSVHNYADQSTAGAQGIANSPTTVRVYGPTGLLRTYVAPAPTTTGNTWRVFGLVVVNSTVTLNDNCSASLPPTTPCGGRSYLTATGPGDMGVFRPGATKPLLSSLGFDA